MKKPIRIQRFGRLLLAGFLLPAMLVGCIDDSFDLDRISTEVHVGGKSLILPLGVLAETQLSSFLDDVEIEGFNSDSGVYTFTYPGEERSYDIGALEIETIDIEPDKIDPVTIKNSGQLPDSFELNDSENSFTVDYPDLNVDPKFDGIDESEEIDTKEVVPGIVPSLATQQLPIDDAVKLDFSVSVPSDVKSLKKLYFREGNDRFPRPTEYYGSPINISMVLNGLDPVSDDGTLDFTITFPENYELWDGEGNVLSPKNIIRVENYPFGDNPSANFTIYLHSVDLSDAEPGADGTINVDDDVMFAGTFEFQPVEGTYYNGQAPVFNVVLNPVYNDVEVVTNTVVIDSDYHETALEYVFDGIPSSVSEINRIAFDQDEGAFVTMRLKGLEWLADELTDITMIFSEDFDFGADEKGFYNIPSRTLTAPLGDMRRGVTLPLNAIDCPGEKGRINGKGQLIINGTALSKFNDIPENTESLLSGLASPYGKAAVPVTMSVTADDTFWLDLANCEVEAAGDEHPFNMSAVKVNRFVEIPEEIKRIDRLFFSADIDEAELARRNGDDRVKADVYLRLAENTVFPVDNPDIDFMINFKKMIMPEIAERISGNETLAPDEDGDYIFKTRMTWADINNNRTLRLASLVVVDIRNLPDPARNDEDVWGVLLNETFGVSGNVIITEGDDINVDFTEDTQVEFDIVVDDLKVSRVEGIVDIAEVLDPMEFDIDLPDNVNVEIEDLAISPIVTLDVSNPFGVPVFAEMQIRPYDANGVLIERNVVELGANKDLYIDGKRKVVLSTEARRSQFENDPDVLFVVADVDNLIRGEIPAKVMLDARVFTDSGTAYTLDLSQDDYTIDYKYDVELPFEFGKDLEIYYTQTVESDALSGIPDAAEKVAFESAGIVADFTTSIPLNLIADVELLDEYDRPLDVEIGIKDGIIRGHNPASEEETTTSRVNIGLDLHGGSLAVLRDMAKIRFKLGLTSPARDEDGEVLCPLKPEQTIAAKLKIRIEGGITADLKDFFDLDDDDDDEYED